MASAKTIQTNNSLDIKEQIQNHFLSNEDIKITQNKIIKTCFDDILKKICFNLDSDNILLDYRYFKFIASPENYKMLIYYIVNIIQNVLKKYDTFVFHVNMNTLTLLHIEKHFTFIKMISEVLKETFPDKLRICYIYNAPFIFSKIISILSSFIDKKTQQKIQLIKE
jgi:hypothetical protein